MQTRLLSSNLSESARFGQEPKYVGRTRLAGPGTARIRFLAKGTIITRDEARGSGRSRALRTPDHLSDRAGFRLTGMRSADVVLL